MSELKVRSLKEVKDYEIPILKGTVFDVFEGIPQAFVGIAGEAGAGKSQILMRLVAYLFFGGAVSKALHNCLAFDKINFINLLLFFVLILLFYTFPASLFRFFKQAPHYLTLD